MTLTINATQCTACGLCIKTCPKCVLAVGDDGKAGIAAPEQCIGCGHCIATCPTQAIGDDQADTTRLATPSGDGITPLAMAEFLAMKRSVRFFTDAPVERELLTQLVEAGRQAPTAKNVQDRGFVVVTGREMIRAMDKAIVDGYRKLLGIPARGLLGLVIPKLRQLNAAAPGLERLCERSDAGGYPIFHDAPAVVIGYGSENNSLSRDNCVIAQQYMMLQGQAMGLGSCSIGYASVRPKPLEAFIDIPAGNAIHTVTIFGHPSVRFLRGVPRDAAKASWVE